MLFTVLAVNACSRKECLHICSELDCVSVNVCSNINFRGDVLAPSFFYHMSSPKLVSDKAMEFYNNASDIEISHNFYHIKSLVIPRGVLISLCEPDFTQSKIQCNAESIQNVSVFNASQLLNVSNPRIQMISYEIDAAYDCFDTSDVHSGFYLDKEDQPNRLLKCNDVPENAARKHCDSQNSSCCDFECNLSFIRNSDNLCVHQCSGFLNDFCAYGQYSVAECLLNSRVFYNCQNCSVLPGFVTLPWNSSNPRQCMYEACLPNTYEQKNQCYNCAEHEFSSEASTQCIKCEIGKYRPSDATTCLPCENVVVSNKNCDEEHQVKLHDLQSVVDYLSLSVINLNDKRRLASNFCATGHFCKYCEPGSFWANNTCYKCNYGYYQPNFGATSCYSCGVGYTTQNTGVIDKEQCVCKAGFDSFIDLV